MVVGHTYYFLEDVYPNLTSTGGYRLLKTPEWFVGLFRRDEMEILPDLQMENVQGNLVADNQDVLGEGDVPGNDER